MSPQITFMGFTEGATFDARGQLALIGFSPQAHVVEQFPAQISPSLVVIIDDSDDGSTIVPGHTANVRVVVANEDGDVVFYVEQATAMNEMMRTKGLPGRLALVAQFPVTVSKAGRYTYNVMVKIGASDLELSRTNAVLVVDQQWLDERAKSGATDEAAQ